MHTKDSIDKAKRQAMILARTYREWGQETGSDTLVAKGDRVAECSTVWCGYKCAACGRLHNMISYGCHDRLCPICAAKQARCTAAQAMQALPIMEGMRQGLSWHLVTLTQRNVEAAALSAEIDRLLQAWAALRHHRTVGRDVAAWARSIEVTYNAKTSTFHPHVHLIVGLSTSDSPCTNSSWWASAWAEVLALDYVPMCDARPMETVAAMYEVSKYVLKVSSVYKMPYPLASKALRTIATAIHGRRLRSYGGLWLKARRLAKMEDAEKLGDTELAAADASLEGATCACGSMLPMMPVALVWAGMQYKEVRYPCSRDISVTMSGARE